MHSKVIFASIVCMLAASFGGAKPVKGNYAQAPKKNESTTSCAPNIEYGYFDIDHNYGDVGETIVCAFYHEQGSNSDFHVIQTPGQPLISVRVLAPVAGPIYVYVPVPSTPGDTVIRFGRNGGSPGAEGKIYIHADGEHAVMSPYSAEDAKKQFFYRYVASKQDKIFLNLRELPTYPFDDGVIIDPDPTFPIIPDPGKGKNFAGIAPANSFSYLGGIATKPDLGGIGIDFGDWLYQLGTQVDAIEHLNNYVYSDVADVVVNAQVTLRGNNTIAMAGNTVLEVNANWIDEYNQSHPLIGAGVDFLHFADKMTGSPSFNTTINYDSNHTNDNGACSITITKAAGKSIKLKDVSMQLTAKNDAIDIKDCFDLNHPYLFRNSSNTLSFVNNESTNSNANTITLNNVASIKYNVTIYPNRSDRAAAYLIAEGETIPYRYTKQFAQRLDPITAYYPAEYTAYEEDKIKIQREDYNNFDILNHEYGHYICDELELCTKFNERKPHGIHEDLSVAYGEETGKKLAFSEGLASYLAFASQNYYYDKYSNIDMIGDYLFFDRFRGGYCYCEFWSYAPSRSGSNPSPKGEATESATISILAKLMDDVSRSGDNVALGDEAIWDVLLEQRNIESISEFVNCLIDDYPEIASGIRSLAALEYVPLNSIAQGPFPNASDKWTIMIYACPSSNLATSLHKEVDNILSVAGQPENVNIIIKVDGFETFGYNYHGTSNFYLDSRFGFEAVLKNGVCYPIEGRFGTRHNMGDPERLEDFVTYCAQNYPAKKMGLIFYDHGRALDGVCHDVHNYDEMYDAPEDPLYNSEVDLALHNVFQNNNLSGKFEFVGYDACLMQVQDVADVNSKYFNYMVASEEYTYHWDWSGFLNAIYTNKSTKTALNALCNDFIAANDDNFPENNKKEGLSYLDLSAMNHYRNKFEKFAAAIKDTVYANYDEFLDVIADTRHYANDPEGAQDYVKRGTIDGYDFLSKLALSPSFAQYADRIYSLMRAYQRVVCYNRVGVDAQDSHGLAIHVCVPGTEQTYRPAETHFNNWRSLFVQD